MREKAILVVFNWKETGVDPLDAASELEELSKAAGLEVKKTFILPMREPNPTTFMGRGKAEEIGLAAKDLRANVIVVDTDLPATQQRNLEEVVEVKTVDRTQLILDIFARRARSNEGKLQVELAQLKYLLPRLAGEGIYLSRLGGGVGTRGPGEQKLEMDRRRLRDKISKLGDELAAMRERRKGAIEKKKEKDFPLVSLVGYTNAGKSTLFNRLTEAGVLQKDQLFSTLDTTTRVVTLPGNLKALMVDTVGFVKRLPHHLVESFRSTLEEALHADLLLHVIDATRNDITEVLDAVNIVLAELGVDDSKVCLVFNKMDALPGAKLPPLKRPIDLDRTFFVSARTGQGMEWMLGDLSRRLSTERSEYTVFIPRGLWSTVHLFYGNGEVLERKDSAQGVTLRLRIPMKIIRQICKKHPDIQVTPKDT